MQTEYAKEAGELANPDPAKDSNEAQVAAFMGRIGGYIERLKQAASSAQSSGSGRVNEHTAAHMHGVVLILAERLHRASMVFDRLRAARYQALVDGRPPGAGARETAGSRVGESSAAAASQSGTRTGRLNGRAARAPGAGGDASGSGSTSGWQHILGLHVAGPKGHEHGHDETAGSPAVLQSGDSQWPVQTAAMELENRALLERLTATRNAAFSVEQSVRDVAALNQMFSSAVLAQAETIESIYMAALEATHNITSGNEALTMTVAVNRSTTRYIVVLLLVAIACLLFFDWFNS